MCPAFLCASVHFSVYSHSHPSDEMPTSLADFHTINASFVSMLISLYLNNKLWQQYKIHCRIIIQP